MNSTIQEKIINVLLDKYERSSLFTSGNQYPRRIMLNFYNGGRCDFPLYDIEKSDQRISVNQAVIDLSKKELIYYEWMKGEYDHIIARVWLNTDNLSLAYQTAARNPKGDIIDKICMEIAGVQNQVKSSWAIRFLQDAHAAIVKKRSLVSAIPGNAVERELLLKAILVIDRMSNTECLERVFSLQTFGNSKTFERVVKSRILSILRKYLEIDDDTANEDLLKQIGIVKYPEQFEFCGKLSVSLNSGVVDFSHLRSGGMIFSSDLSLGSISVDPSVESVITIENRANYIDYIQRTKTEKELIIYHGGQYSPRKRVFLQMTANAAPKNCRWYHWSDIDYGGFIMLSRLRIEVNPDVIPYRMNSGELERYNNLTVPVNGAYIEKLKRLKLRPEISDCFDCIDYMVKKMMRLEQEAMLIDSNIE